MSRAGIGASVARRVLSWGEGHLGCLGLGGFEGSRVAKEVEGVPDGGVSRLAAGWGHTAAVCEGGRLFVWGRPYDFRNLMRLHRIRRFSGSLADAINWMASWDSKTLMLTPQEIKVEDGEKTVLDVSCGAGLTAVISSDKKVYMLGNNQLGQCGTGADKPFHFYELTRTKLPLALNFKSVKLGLQHALALSEDGQVFAWGKGERGQLALDALSPSNVASPAQTLISQPVSSIDCGLNHSIAVTEKGQLLVWGKMQSKEIAKTRGGVAIYHDQTEPRVVEIDNGGSAVVEAVCSLSQILARTADGKLWLAGMVPGSLEMLHDPVQVPLPELLEKREGTASERLLFKGWDSFYYSPSPGQWLSIRLAPDQPPECKPFTIPGMGVDDMNSVVAVIPGWDRGHALIL